MRIRVKQRLSESTNRIDSLSGIDNVLVEEDLINPSREVISIFFRGNNSSGILSFTTEEFEALARSIKPHTHLVKPASSKKTSKKTAKKKTSASKKKKRSTKTKAKK